MEDIFREVALVDLRVGVPLVDLGVLRAVDQDFLLAAVPVDQEAEARVALAVVQVALAVVQVAQAVVQVDRAVAQEAQEVAQEAQEVVREAREVVAQEAREAEALEVQEALLFREVLVALEVLAALGDLVVPVEVLLLQLLMTAVELML